MYHLTAESVNPATNLPYIAWKMGLGGFRSEYAWMINRDNAYWQQFMGQPYEQFRLSMGNEFHDGSRFPISSARGKFFAVNSRRNPDAQYLFFDDNHAAWGWCVIVVDGRVSGFALAKG